MGGRRPRLRTVDLVIVALERAVVAKGLLLELLENLLRVRHVALGGEQRQRALHGGSKGWQRGERG